MSRIGVFVCHCGHNISATVDCAQVAEYFKEYNGVIYSTDYKYMCSDPGQNLVKDAVIKYNLNGVVVAACSPHMHENTFRNAVEQAGLNPYLCEMANIREHCSWVHTNKENATKKAIDLVRMMVEKVRYNSPLEPIRVPVTKRVLVIGGGIAGIQCALDIANGGHKVVMVEKEPSIGGHMSQLSETFPTLDCSQCILTPRMVEVATHPNITLHTYSELVTLSGFVGNFIATIRNKAKSVIADQCTGCGACWNKCPVKQIPSEFEENLGKRTAIYVPFPQAVPNVPVIDRENCIYFKTGKCGLCKKICPCEAIDFEQRDELLEIEVGSVVVATGYELLDHSQYKEYGLGNDPDIINGLQFERLASASGPTGGVIRRPSDGEIPQIVVFVQCVGSRDPAKGYPYCSKICCMYTAKHAMLYKHSVPNGQAIVFYIDVRAGGKNYEEFVRRTMEEDKTLYLRGRVSKIVRKNNKLIVKGSDTLSGENVEVEADLVVLATAVRPRRGSDILAQKLSVSYDTYNFFNEAHPKLRPVETNTAGIFLAGACQASRDIPEVVAQAGGAAAKVLGLFSQPELKRLPIVAYVTDSVCIGCQDCIPVCPYKAISPKQIINRSGESVATIADINSGLCQGCGTCVTTCRSHAITLDGFTDEQLFYEITSLSIGN